jgi:hypothetical protein
MITDPKQNEFISSLEDIWFYPSKFLLVDVLAFIPVSLIFSELDYTVIISVENLFKILSIFGLLAVIKGFSFLLLFAMTSQRVSGYGRTASEWGKASKGQHLI